MDAYASAPEKIHLAIAFDSNYLQQFYALAASTFAHHAKGEISFHVITSQVPEEAIRKIEAYVQAHQNEIKFYTVDESDIKKLVLINQWTHAVYLRLFFPLIVPNSLNRILYLDMDTLVLNPLHELWQIDFHGMPVAAVYDNYVKTQPLLGINQEGEYFNSGVLLMDLHRWNELRVSENTINYLHENPEKILFVDQCGLNAVLKGQWLKLPARFNFIYSSVPPTASMKELKQLVKGLAIVHYTLQRPWHMLCRNRLSYLYFDYLGLSPASSRVSRYTDFDILKIPMFLKIKLLNLYFDFPFLGTLWRKLKI